MDGREEAEETGGGGGGICIGGPYSLGELLTGLCPCRVSGGWPTCREMAGHRRSKTNSRMDRFALRFPIFKLKKPWAAMQSIFLGEKKLSGAATWRLHTVCAALSAGGIRGFRS